LAEVGAAVANTSTFFGVQGEELETLSTLFLDFARLTNTEVGTSMRNVRGLMTQFGFGVEDIDEVLGDFNRVAQATGTPMAMLLQQMETFGPLFTNAGFSVEQSAAIFGQLERAGVSITRVGPGLNKFFRDVAESGADPQAALRGTVALIRDMEDSGGALSLAMEKFGAEGAQRLVTAIRTGNFELTDFNDLLGDGAGTISVQAKAVETLSDKLSIFKNRLLMKIAPVAERVFDGVVSFVDRMGPALDTITATVEEKGLAGALGSFLVDGWNYLKDVGLPWLGTNLAKATDFLWEWIKEKTPGAINALSRGLSEMWLYLQTTGMPWLGEKLTEAGDVFVDWIRESLPDVFHELGEWVGEVLAWMDSDGIPQFQDWTEGAMETIGEWIPLAIEGLIDSLIEAFKGLGDGLGEDEGARTSWIDFGTKMGIAFTRGLVKGLLQTDYLESKIDEIQGAWDQIWGAASGAASGTASWLDNLNPFKGAGFIGATGGIVTKPTMSLIGEAGPEMVIPLNQAPGASPLPGGLGGSTTININMPTGANGEDVINAIKRETRNRGSAAFPVTAGRRR
jgi:hypothetical protein